MEEHSSAQAIEIFHLLFVQVLTSHGRDRFVLKGGANLRYYFGSLRYSNDIDLDVTANESWHVEQTVDSVLAGRALTILLSQQEMAIGESSKSKQTETTRRWKLGLVLKGVPEPLVRTKIEFSNRGITSGDVHYETIPRQVVDPYAIRPATMSHYGQTAALEQKMAALALRGETKARDIFDLELLLRLRRASGGAHDLNVSHAAQAGRKAMEVSYTSFRSEVFPFLDPDVAALYEGEDEWERMCAGVSEELVALDTSEGKS